MLRHMRSYWQLVGWILGKAFRWFGWRIAYGAVLSIASALFDLVAFYLILKSFT